MRRRSSRSSSFARFGSISPPYRRFQASVARRINAAPATGSCTPAIPCTGSLEGREVAQEDPKRSDLPQAPSSPRSPEPPERSPATPSQRPRLRMRWWWVAFALALFAVNYWVGTRVTEEEPRLSVPYSPFFLDQVRGGNVAEITSEGSTVQGKFERPRRYDDS